jgi:NAD(P)-dependent dehydrogenase (short-subunit alcohol dehydrogenase family)
MNISLSSKVALITGGRAALARLRECLWKLARRWSSIIRAKGPAEQLVKELGAGNCAAVACDLSGTQTAQQLVSAASILVVSIFWLPTTESGLGDSSVDRLSMNSGTHGYQSRQRVFAG